MIESNCVICGKKFYKGPGHLGKRRVMFRHPKALTCSKSCGLIYRTSGKAKKPKRREMNIKERVVAAQAAIEAIQKNPKEMKKLNKILRES